MRSYCPKLRPCSIGSVEGDPSDLEDLQKVVLANCATNAIVLNWVSFLLRQMLIPFSLTMVESSFRGIPEHNYPCSLANGYDNGTQSFLDLNDSNFCLLKFLYISKDQVLAYFTTQKRWINGLRVYQQVHLACSTMALAWWSTKGTDVHSAAIAVEIWGF